MTTMANRRPVAVKQLPEKFSLQQGREFFRQLEACLNSDRPRIVLDCSKLQHLDTAGIHVLLRCLEEAMKRNGDVKLAALSARPAATLELSGVNRLFESFDTTADAVHSFQQLPVFGFQHALGLAYSAPPQQNSLPQPLSPDYSSTASESTA
jgi:anti-anti-sigma factor